MSKNFNLEFTKKILSSNKSVLSILLLIATNFLLIPKYSANFEYIDAFISVNNLFIYNTIIAAILLLSTLNTIKIFEQNKILTIRFQKKEKYFLELLKTVLIVNLIVILLNFILLLTNLNFFANSLKIQNFVVYNIPNILYAVFIFLKKIFLFEFLSVIFLISNQKLNKNLSIIVSLVIVLLLFVAPYSDIYINSIFNIRLFYWDYFVYHRYSSFLLELSLTSIYFCGCFMVCYILSKYIIKNLKEIGD